MADEQVPFADVIFSENGDFSIPVLKWRELLFVGALHPVGLGFTRESSRPLPPFRLPDLFPVGVLFEARHEGGRVMLRRVKSLG